MREKKKLCIAVDSNAIIHRAFHAYPPSLTSVDGLQVNAVFGFASMLLKILDTFNPEYIVCAFDTEKPTFRHADFADYKANRKPTDMSLIAQFPLVDNLVESFNIPILKKDGFEADDILGSIAERFEHGKWKDENIDLYIVSGDRDLLQLVSEKVKVVLPEGSFKNLKIFDRDAVKEKMGVYPEQIVDFKALVGDPSDNIPGVQGIGIKTAVSLLNKYDTVEGIYKHIDELKPRHKKLLEEGIENASLSRSLATIKRDLDINIDLRACVFKDFDRKKVIDIFKRFGFKSLISKIPSSDRADIANQQMGLFEAAPPEVSDDCKDLGRLTSSPSLIIVNDSQDCLGLVDNSANDVDCVRANIRQMVSRGLGAVYPLWSQAAVSSLRQISGESGSWDALHQRVAHFFILRFWVAILNSGYRVSNLEDLFFDFLADYRPSGTLSACQTIKLVHDLYEELITRLGALNYDKTFLTSWIDFSDIEDWEKPVQLNFMEVMVALIATLMEERGILVERSRLLKLQEKLSSEINVLKSRIFDLIGHEINLNSPKQLADWLFNEVGLPARTKKSTRESVLLQYKDAHPAIELILQYRKLFKLKSSYFDSFLDLLKLEDDGENWALHTHFDTVGTTSGRFASRNPNLQNLPTGDEIANQVKSIFKPRNGFTFVSVDYSQIELRVLAHLSKDIHLVNDFLQDKDIHKATAGRIFHKETEDVTAEERAIGKRINFGMVYGQTQFGLSKQLGISVEEASEYIQEYFDNYAGVKDYIQQAQTNALENGYVQTFLGRRRFIAGLRSSNKRVQAAAIREAINMPIQGGAADIMRLAMISAFKLIQNKYRGEAFILLQIHDEFIFEVKKDKLSKFKDDIINLLERVVVLEVPLRVHFSVSDRLDELK